MEDANGNHGLLVEIITRRNKKVECFFAREEMATEKETTKLLLQKGLIELKRSGSILPPQ